MYCIKCHYVECPVSFIVMLNVIMLSAVMLNVIMLRVIMLNVFMLNIVMLSAVLVNVVILSAVMPNVVAICTDKVFLGQMSVGNLPWSLK